jgi:hypothetical protein
MYGRAHEDERDSDTDSYLTEAHDQSALRASYGHTGETRSPGPSESDVGVSAQRLVVDSARSNSMNRKGRDDELCERAMEVMLSLSHWQGLAAHGRSPDRRKRSFAFRGLGQNGRSRLAVFLLPKHACLLQLCRPTVPWRRTASLGYMI